MSLRTNNYSADIPFSTYTQIYALNNLTATLHIDCVRLHMNIRHSFRTPNQLAWPPGSRATVHKLSMHSPYVHQRKQRRRSKQRRWR